MQFPSLIVDNINASIDSVLLPVMSSAQDDRKQVKTMTRRAIKTSTYVMAPMMMGLAAVAPALVELILTEKWLPCVPFLRIFCLTYMFYPIHTANLNAIKAMGRSDLFLKLEIVKKAMGMTVLFCVMWFGVMAMAYSMLLVTVLSMIVNSWPNKKLLDYGYFEQMKDILPGILTAVLMDMCVLAVQLLRLSALATLMLQVALGALVYIVISAVFGLESFVYLWNMIRPVILKNRK